MVTATGNPKLIRVQFNQRINDLAQAGIVCFLQVREQGARIFYSHHLMYSRPLPKGPWDRPEKVKASLSHTLKAQIYTGVWRALADVLSSDEPIENFPMPESGVPEEADLD